MCIDLFHRGIEWVSLTSFLSFATSAPNNMGLVRNELQHVDLPTGERHTRTYYHLPEGTNHNFCIILCSLEFSFGFLHPYQHKKKETSVSVALTFSFICLSLSVWFSKRHFHFPSREYLHTIQIKVQTKQC